MKKVVGLFLVVFGLAFLPAVHAEEKSRAELHVVVHQLLFILLEPYLCFSFDSSSERGSVS